MKKKLVLLVDDDPEDADLTLRAIGALLPYCEVVRAADGAEALDFLLGRGAHAGRDTAAIPALILLDIVMPRLGGLDLMKRLGREWADGLRRALVVVLSHSCDERDRKAAGSLGVRHYYRKPLTSADCADLVLRLRAYLEGAVTDAL
jgi:two-component system, response regulator